MSIQISHISDFFETWAPKSTQAEYDNSGLLIGSQKNTVTGILTCLDVTHEVVDEAISVNCNLIIAHHPVIFRKLSAIDPDTEQGSLLYKLIRNDISVLAVHTNLDAARDGVSFVLADVLALQDVRFLSYHDNEESIGYGAIGQLEAPLSVPEFLNHVCQSLATPAVRYAGSVPDQSIQTVAVCGGTGISLASAATLQKADAFVTADIKYHEYFDFPHLLKVDAGHYETEFPIASHLKSRLSKEFHRLPIYVTRTLTNPMRSHINTEFNHHPKP